MAFKLNYIEVKRYRHIVKIKFWPIILALDGIVLLVTPGVIHYIANLSAPLSWRVIASTSFIKHLKYDRTICNVWYQEYTCLYLYIIYYSLLLHIILRHFIRRDQRKPWIKTNLAKRHHMGESRNVNIVHVFFST